MGYEFIKKNGEAIMYRILIVDDERIERRGIRFLLKKMGLEMEVFEASNGKEALEFLEKQDVDILFTDVKMPFMDGLELIQQIIPKKSDMKVVIFSGYSEFEYARHALQLGAKNYILKPVDPKEFESTVLELMKELEQEQLKQQIKEKEHNFMKEHILYELINGIPLETMRKRTEGLTDFKFLNTFSQMFFIEFSNDFFGKVGINFPEILKKQIDWNFTYLNLNPLQCILLLHKEEKIDGKQGAKEITMLLLRNFRYSPILRLAKS